MGDEIPKLARILHVADAFEAMTADRPYRKALSNEQALAELRKFAGVQFDPEVVDAFVRTSLGRGHSGPGRSPTSGRSRSSASRRPRGRAPTTARPRARPRPTWPEHPGASREPRPTSPAPLLNRSPAQRAYVAAGQSGRPAERRRVTPGCAARGGRREAAAEARVPRC